MAWDWWNDWNLYNVDFRAGINNETYKYYIDFASKFGIEYVILDEGWAVPGKADLFEVIPEIDLKELISYAKSKNVDLILWAGYRAFEKTWIVYVSIMPQWESKVSRLILWTVTTNK